MPSVLIARPIIFTGSCLLFFYGPIYDARNGSDFSSIVAHFIGNFYSHSGPKHLRSSAMTTVITDRPPISLNVLVLGIISPLLDFWCCFYTRAPLPSFWVITPPPVSTRSTVSSLYHHNDLQYGTDHEEEDNDEV